VRRGFVAIPGAIFIAIAAALWGTDALLRKPLAESTQAATIVFGEHLVLVLLTLPLIPAALVAVRRAGPRYVAAADASIQPDVRPDHEPITHLPSPWKTKSTTA